MLEEHGPLIDPLDQQLHSLPQPYGREQPEERTENTILDKYNTGMSITYLTRWVQEQQPMDNKMELSINRLVTSKHPHWPDATDHLCHLLLCIQTPKNLLYTVLRFLRNMEKVA